ncbi:MAG: amidohydrolase [Oscillospiraceae bacterium]|jgi:imidazolonepropionase-like amidohydrolase|nr:amidohydrolase [Oscillospiraceae bacterium]
MLIKNGTIHDAVNALPYQADIALRDGVIAAIGPGLQPLDGEEVLDAAGKQVYPGFVDAHSHLGLDNYGMGWEGHDYNEMGDVLACQLRGIDSFNPRDTAIPAALRGGVTTVGTGPGSANVLGGTFLAVKTYGSCVDDMVIQAEVAMKCAFGENPKRCYKEKGNSARMTTAAKLREMFFQARDYGERKAAAGDDPLKRPKFDMKLEALLPVLRGEIPLKAHAHRADDICTAIRIAKEFGVKLTLEHCTEGHLIVEELQRAGWPVAVGPTLTHASKIELVNKTFETPGILARAGLQVSIITDSPVIPQQYLPLCAGLAVKAGMDPFAALQAITINPAKHLGVAGRVGSLELGKDADVVVANGDPMVSDTVIEAVILNGQKVAG